MDIASSTLPGLDSSRRVGGTRSAAVLLSRRVERVSRALLVVVTLVAAMLSLQHRYALAASLSLQCDEIPLLVRFTGLCGYVTNEAQAAKFTPSVYTFRHGALRSVRSPRIHCSLHTSSGFWANLTTHLFGASPLAIRVAPMFWSLLAIVAAGWGAWLVSRSLLATCTAVWFCAYAPHAVVYAAQIRGYAEAMALSTILLILLEYFRRRPDRWMRGALVFVCAWQLSLTVYTVWVYWVLPTLIVAVFVVPPSVERADQRKPARASLGVILIGVVAAMTVYTVDRWTHITTQASQMGYAVSNMADALHFLGTVAQELLPSPIWLSLLALPGVVALAKSRASLWKWSAGVGLAVPILFMLVNGSAGYARNLGYLTGVLAILVGLGAQLVWRKARRSLRRVPVTMMFAMVLALSTAWAHAKLPERVDRLVLPDWGAAVKAVDAQPVTVGPRWFCHCLANRWQINWYRPDVDYAAFLAVPAGGRIEVVMGAWHDASGQPTVFRVAPHRPGIFEDSMPGYLADSPVDGVIRGVALRRWVGTRLCDDESRNVNPDDTVFILSDVSGVQSPNQWRRFLATSQAYERGVVTFKEVAGGQATIHSMMVPGDSLNAVRAAMVQELQLDPADIHVFSLQPLASAREN